MLQILVIDDEHIYQQMVERALTPLGYKIITADTGEEGIKTAKEIQPDLIITDVVMPDVDGYEVTRRLRREPEFAHTPILILTAQTEIQDKLKSFEAGADDHITKPFDPAELGVRVEVHIRRAEATAAALPPGELGEKQARVIAVHSLRGGVGCSSLAVNLAISLFVLWGKPTMLLDLDLMAGQVALMLNSTLKRTWADLAQVNPAELDMDVLHSVITSHESGLHIIAAPTFPSEAEVLTTELLTSSMGILDTQYDYIIADLSHDFSEVTLAALDMADVILLFLAPEMASLRAVAAALDTYTRLDYDETKIKLVLNTTFPHQGLSRDKIEAAISYPITLAVPFVPEKFVTAINIGKPLIIANHKEPVTALIEDFAFHISNEKHKHESPVNPSSSWKRVYKRYKKRRKEKEVNS